MLGALAGFAVYLLIVSPGFWVTLSGFAGGIVLLEELLAPGTIPTWGIVLATIGLIANVVIDMWVVWILDYIEAGLLCKIVLTVFIVVPWIAWLIFANPYIFGSSLAILLFGTLFITNKAEWWATQYI